MRGLNQLLPSSSRLLFSSLLLTILFCTENSNGQPTMDIKGVVIDGTANRPIPFVTVFLDGTTKGALTDTTGHFTLKNIAVGRYDLVVRAIGYKTEHKEVIVNPLTELRMKIFLTQQEVTLNEVQVSAIRDRSWQRDFDEFKIKFIGPSSEVTILNPAVLTFDRTIQGLRVTATKPILIDNRLLGYRLEVTLNEFYAFAKTNWINYTAWMRYDTLSSRNRQEYIHWLKSRVKAYRGSETHLFKSILDGRAEEEGFHIIGSESFTNGLNPSQLLNLTLNAFQKETQEMAIAKALLASRERDISKKIANANLIINNSKDNLTILPQGVYRIIYYNKIVPKALRSVPGFQLPLSYLDVPPGGIQVWPNGQPKLPIRYKRGGYFNLIRIDQQLPFDYDPVEAEAKSIIISNNEVVTLQGTVRDSASKKPLVGVEVFINNGLTKSITNARGRFKLEKLEPGPYTLGFYLSGKKINRLNVIADPEKSLIQQLDVTLNGKPAAIKEFPIGPKFPVDAGWDILSRYFQAELMDSKFTELTHITNLEDLRFANNGKKVTVQSMKPIIFEDQTIGFRWTVFLESATLTEKSSQYKLTDFSGLIKMDTLPSRNNRIRKIRIARQYDYLPGTWKHIVNSMIDGSAQEAGYRAYTFNEQSTSNKRFAFKKIINNQLNEVSFDSLVTVIDNKVFLKIPKGLEIHNSNKVGANRYYRGYSKQIIRLSSTVDEVNLPKNGGLPSRLQLVQDEGPIIVKTPVDFRDPMASPTDPRVLVLIKEANLKAIKNWREKVYVSTDRDHYHAGDTIWFKAHMKYSNKKYVDSLSKVLHIELISADQKCIKHSLFKIEEGSTDGGIVIPKMNSGDYFLRAYTTWMKNFGEEFIKPLPILSDSLSIVPLNAAMTDPLVSDTTLTVIRNMASPTETALTLKLGSKAKFKTVSIAVTDVSVVPPIAGAPSILTFDNSFQADGSTLLRKGKSIEKEIVYNGKINIPHSIDQHDTITVNSYSTTLKKTFYSKPFLGSNFRINFDFTDTTALHFRAFSTRGEILGDIEVLSIDSATIDFDPYFLKYQTEKRELKNYPYYLPKKAEYQNQNILKRKDEKANTFIIQGFEKPLHFNTVKKNSGTVYWNANLKLDEHGNATFPIKLPDTKGPFLITIEGLSTSGDPIRLVKNIPFTN